MKIYYVNDKSDTKNYLEPGKTYTRGDEKNPGFAAFLTPLACFTAFPGCYDIYEAELEEVADTKSHYNEAWGNKITLGKKLTVEEIHAAHKAFTEDQVITRVSGNNSVTFVDRSKTLAQAGKNSNIALRQYCVAEAGGYSYIAVSKNSAVEIGAYSNVVAGDGSSISTAGMCNVSAGRNSCVYFAASGGNIVGDSNCLIDASAATDIISGSDSKISAGHDCTVLADKGSEIEAGPNSLITAYNSRAKGGLGTVLVLAVKNEAGEITDFAAGIVDGKEIKADTWYEVKDGKFVEVKEFAGEMNEKEQAQK